MKQKEMEGKRKELKRSKEHVCKYISFPQLKNNRENVLNEFKRH